MTPDYKEILKRYMQHVKKSTGIFCLDDSGFPYFGPPPSLLFGWQELKEIIAEIESERKED